MIIELDMNSSTPIYVQLRNQIVMGIGRGELKLGESLPTVRQLAQDIGVNTMTVNKAYQILKTEGYIKIDRRHGAIVSDNIDMDIVFREKLENELELLLAEANLSMEWIRTIFLVCAMKYIQKSKCQVTVNQRQHKYKSKSILVTERGG